MGSRLARVLRAGFATGALAAVAASGALAPAAAEEWGGIQPGTTPMPEVRERFGAPSKETHVKVDGYDTTEWVYEDTRAPGGILRMSVSFGLLTSQGYKATLVRVLRLEPKPHVFRMTTVIQGFGVPDGVTTQNEQEVFFYRTGLLVTFDKTGEEAIMLNFTMPQPAAPPGTRPPSPAQSAPAAPKR
ncbi:MAG TPA: hypothetical protein VEH80_03165 [Candidatus Bathyarchaeia archaeon]|nr:hypothetical protein [Candidatus Bathyarchaeia archaeon]